MQMKIELVQIPVTDIDRAKAFYVEHVGFHLDHDVQPTQGMRIVQLTPLGSSCSILLGTGVNDIDAMTPGSAKNTHLVVASVPQARDALMRRGVHVSEIQEFDQGIKAASFSDPDGNSWILQEIPWRSVEFQ